MTSTHNPILPDEAQRQVGEIQAAADRLGVELNADEALRWIVAVSAVEREHSVAQDAGTGIFGHNISLLDFDTQELDHFRRLAQKVRLVRRDNVESAIAIAGSSAQGKVQLFPGDTDFFERVNIRTATEQAARETLRTLLRETALRAFAEPDVVLLEVNLGVYTQPVIERRVPRAAGDPITWTPSDVQHGFIEVQSADAQPIRIAWDDVQSGMGWSYLGYIVADAQAGRIALASNMLDVSWEAPDGTIVPLDGALDPFFQEIYLESEALPLFSKLIRHVDPNALGAYIAAMRGQAFHYTHEEPNYGKAAKRLYNLFRLTDQLEAAAYVRELFDEPGAKLYQVPGLLDAVDVARTQPTRIRPETLVRQIDTLIRAVVEAAEGPAEADLVMALIHLRDHVLGREGMTNDWSELLQRVRRQCSELINEFFRVRLLGLPQIASYVVSLADASH